jgi:hypothetical protein
LASNDIARGRRRRRQERPKANGGGVTVFDIVHGRYLNIGVPQKAGSGKQSGSLANKRASLFSQLVKGGACLKPRKA